MTRASFLLGISAIGFVAGAANAQTVTTTNGDTTDPNTGDRVVVSCVSGNSCSVFQGATGTTFNSTGSVNAYNGTNNSLLVSQSGNRLYGQAYANGSNNNANVFQRGFSNSASVSQTGSNTGTNAANTAFIDQGANGNSNVNNDSATIVQVRTASAASSAGSNQSYVFQNANSSNNAPGGFNNAVTVTQNGTNLSSYITQDTPTGSNVAASNNSATVLQVGRGGTPTTGTTSSINQDRSGNIANVSLFDGGNTTNAQGGSAQNNSFISQTNTLFTTGPGGAGFAAAGGGNNQTTANSPNTGNSAIVAITGQQNYSSVMQNGVQNGADQSLLTGGPGNTSAANATGTDPGTGAPFPAGRPEGNSSQIMQNGRGNYAATSIGGQSTPGGGRGNRSSITQYQTDATVTAITLNSVQSATTAHRALVYQRGILDEVSIYQTNNNVGGAAAASVQSGSLADVSQLSFNSNVFVNQTGTNTARVTQGARTETTGADDSAQIIQTDAGDITSTGGNGGFGGGSITGSSRNFGEIAQYGIQNVSVIQQNAVNASASVYQAVGTRNYRATVLQGIGGDFGGSIQQNNADRLAANQGAGAQNLVAIINQTAGQSGSSAGAAIAQNGRNLTATANQAGGTATAGPAAGVESNDLILINQAYDFNSVTVSQNGTNLSARVDQRGAGSAAFRNLVTITQSNDNNSAKAVQTQNVGASSAGDATAGVSNDVNFPNSRSGANSAEIAILQSGTGGSATVEQRGKGQYASITQSGTGNTGGILQEANATNAVAVLSQSGSGNTYYIDQQAAGQYIRVSQSGSGNTMATSIVNGPSGPGNTGNGATVPNFGGIQ